MNQRQGDGLRNIASLTNSTTLLGIPGRLRLPTSPIYFQNTKTTGATISVLFHVHSTVEELTYHLNYNIPLEILRTLMKALSNVSTEGYNQRFFYSHVTEESDYHWKCVELLYIHESHKHVCLGVWI